MMIKFADVITFLETLNDLPEEDQEGFIYNFLMDFVDSREILESMDFALDFLEEGCDNSTLNFDEDETD